MAYLLMNLRNVNQAWKPKVLLKQNMESYTPRLPSSLYNICIRSKYVSRGYTKSFMKFSEIHLMKMEKRPKIFRYKSVLLKVLGVGSGIFTGCAVAKWRTSLIFCEPHLSHHTRLVGMNSIEELHQEARFDWKKFVNLLRTEVWYILVAVASALIVAALNIHIPVLLGDMVNVISRFIVRGGSENGNVSFLDEVRGPSIRLIYMYLAQSLFTFVYISTLSVSGERLACNMRKALFAAVVKQDISFFDAHKSGEIASRLTNDVQEFKSCYKLCISQGLRSLAQTAGCVVSLYIISPKMTALMVCVMPLIIGAGTVIGRVLRRMSKSAQSQIARASAVADEAIGNIRTVRAFAMEEKEKELYKEEVEGVQKLNSALGVGIGIFQGLTNLALNGIVLGVLYIGGSLMHSADMSPGSMMSFLVATQTIQKSLAHLSMLFGQFVRGLAAGARLFQYMNLYPTIPLTGGIILPEGKAHGDVQFKNVTFAYPTRPDQVVLRNFSLNLPPGKMVALCGLSGGGKSTVAALLERFFDVNEGSITVDGYDIRLIDPSWLRGNVIGFINQEPVLFATSIIENIRYGKPDATDEEVLEAAKLANADDFIRSFSEGYNTLIGERGVTVSGGQKQRIAIARALLKDPTILILDEATSALDVESEQAVQEALDYVVKGRTVLVIAHRLSTIQNADIIAVVREGEIAEIGNHHNLTKKKGLYWNLIKQQQTEEEIGLIKEKTRLTG